MVNLVMNFPNCSTPPALRATSPASMLLYKQMKHFNIYLTLAYQCFDCMRFISDGKTMAVRAARERIRQPY